MTKEERLRLLEKQYGFQYKHHKVVSSVLEKIREELHRLGIPSLDDYSHPYHIVAFLGGKKISLHCSGLNSFIDVQPLTVKGHPDNKYKEKRFVYPKRAASYTSGLKVLR